jgi:CBS domain-containing protein
VNASKQKVSDANPRFFYERKVKDHMTKNVVSLAPENILRDAGDLFDRFDFNSIPVLKDGKLTGIISKFDFMRAFAFTEEHPLPDYDAIMNSPLHLFMREELITVSPDTPLTRVLQRMVERRTRSFPVVTDDRIVGIISREDIIRALKETTNRN